MNPVWTASYIALWAVVAAMAVIIMGLLRQLGLVQLRLGIEPGALITRQGLERGAKAPDFGATEVATGRKARLSEHRGRRVALVFLSTSCVACRKLAPHLNSVAHDQHRDIDFLVICSSTAHACDEFVRMLGLDITMLVDPTGTIAGAYRVEATPFAFLIDEEGVVLIRGIVNTWPQLEALLREEGTIQANEPWLVDADSTKSGSGGVGVWQPISDEFASTILTGHLEGKEELSHVD